MKKDLLDVAGLKSNEIERIFRLAEKLKKKHETGQQYKPLIGKTLGLIFNKASTRTRISFETGMVQLGGHPIFLRSEDLQIGRGETVRDSSKIFSLYLDAIVVRTFSHSYIEEIARNSSIPVINGLTDLHHPCQIISDLYTIKKFLGGLKGVKIAYIGDSNNIVNSLMEGCAIFGIHLAISSPDGYEPNPLILKNASETARKSEGSISLHRDPKTASVDADIFYTDVWTSMGQEKEQAKRRKVFKNYQINPTLLQYGKKEALVMHCLPAHRGEEITANVIDGNHSIVFEQAANRLHIQKAIMELLLC